jgi:putative Holliday junction resolvase
VSQYRTILGFDYGTRRIGIAVGQELTATARGLITLQNNQGKPDWPRITQLIKEWQPELLVVGMPTTMDNQPHLLEESVKDFGNQLKQRYNLPVEWIDEKLSSVEAEELLAESDIARQRRQDKAEIDRLAAQIILQSWLNTNAAKQGHIQ